MILGSYIRLWSLPPCRGGREGCGPRLKAMGILIAIIAIIDITPIITIIATIPIIVITARSPDKPFRLIHDTFIKNRTCGVTPACASTTTTLWCLTPVVSDTSSIDNSSTA